MQDQQIALYLAGNIQKKNESSSKIFWTQADQELLARASTPYELTFLNPATRTDDLSDQKSVFGRDITQVTFADAIVVDARERRGLGVGAEMMWAKVNRKPVITLAPKGTHYQQTNLELLGVIVDQWTHPFIFSLSDCIIDDLEEAGAWLKAWREGKVEVKGPEVMEEAMHHYQQTQLPKDVPMQELISDNEKLKSRLDAFASLATK